MKMDSGAFCYAGDFEGELPTHGVFLQNQWKSYNEDATHLSLHSNLKAALEAATTLELSGLKCTVVCFTNPAKNSRQGPLGATAWMISESKQCLPPRDLNVGDVLRHRSSGLLVPVQQVFDGERTALNVIFSDGLVMIVSQDELEGGASLVEKEKFVRELVMVRPELRCQSA